jgi:hypothetical protein
MPPWLARHDRDGEDLSIAELACRLGRAQATVNAYLYDPSARRHARSRSAIAACTAVAARRPPPANSKGDAYEYCKACDPGTLDARTGARRDARLARALWHRGTRARR